MKVSKSSWHYFLYEISFEHGIGSGVPTNLCPYFWRVVAGAIKALLVFAVVLAIIVGAGFTVLKWPLESLGVVAAIVAACALIHYEGNIRSLFTSRDDGEVGEEETHQGRREPGLIRSYLKAKKDKVCPLIEFVE